MYEKIPPVPFQFAPEKRPIAWVTWLLIGSTVVVFSLQLFVLYLTRVDVIGETLAFGPDAWAHHRYWTLITYAWAHAVAMFGDSSLFWLHIVSNMIPLICLGPALEEMLGPLRFFGLYLGGAIAAALVWFASISYFGTGGDRDPSIIGASGAVFAVIAAIGTAAPRVRVTVLLFYVLPLRMSMRVLALLICGLEAAQVVFHWWPEIAHSAHLGGAAFGFLYTLALRRHIQYDL